MISLKWTLFYGGACVHPEKIVLSKGKWKKRLFPALFSLLIHPEHGPILFDTGYTQRFHTETHRFPYRLYRMVTPVHFKETDAAHYQIQQLGYKSEEIRYIILSHFHADHIGGCMDFPHATFICSKKAYQAVQGKTGFSAVKRGFIPYLLPNDFKERVQFVEESKRVSIEERFSPFLEGYDLFGDGSVIAVDLPGHAFGQIGIFFQNEQAKPVFLAADSCWLKEQYEEKALPHPLANLITDDPQAYQESLTKVHLLSIRHPEVQIVPSHCLETWLHLRGNGST
ncbi:MBL fold metallo-hydrolase [Thermoflavimicrobium dichotomicum]|uniref:Metallo-beta-lactamase superfamily protein n=1 Tax=Thermoflavimicrobium dichotomicum TaxID=46223 RepID=A0A1I3JQT2_9BACL|nr:MBL fold metallo-hydrolase [Thermoflavimicrobium dichotomicum]SFI62612.1 Metallo-beta-lactamase superfamily protein [Thermoflavimicrobium dichotomicum]